MQRMGASRSAHIAFLARWRLAPPLMPVVGWYSYPMKTRSLFVVSSMALAVVVALAVTACSKRKNHLEHFQDVPGLLSAIRAFSGDLAKQGQPMPPSVSLRELVSRGYISTNSVHAFEGMETKIWLLASPGVPDSVLMSARLPDGTVNAALADGSIQQFSAQGFAAHLKKTGQDGAANRSQPLRP
jgi:hypothetical protein